MTTFERFKRDIRSSGANSELRSSIRRDVDIHDPMIHNLLSFSSS